MAVLRLRPALKRYAWGDARRSPELLGIPEDGEPVAEAWFGAHPQGPAEAFDAAGGKPLDARVAAGAEALLGARVAERYGGLPYLVKLLAAARPLSIQVHPDPAQAAAGFAREEAAGIARDARERCYRDDRAKPELLVALGPFDALVGFRSAAEIATSLAPGGLLRDLGGLLPGPEPETLVRAYFAMDAGSRGAALESALARARARGGDEDARWLRAAHEALGSPATPDPGLAFVLWLKRVRLRPGEGLFLPAGVPHAYLRGAGIEVMASSDNVLRAGLTSKHVDPAELLREVRFAAPAPAVLTAPAAGEAYPTPAPEFALTPCPEELVREAQGPETLLFLGPPGVEARLETGAGDLRLARGHGVLIPHGEAYRAIAPAGSLWLVRVGAC